MNPQVDLYLQQGCGRCSLFQTPQCKVHPWQEVLIALREILLTCNLQEDLKWSVPCYTNGGKNVLIMAAFKDYAALNLFKGSLLADPKGVLLAAGPNSRIARQIRFTSTAQVKELEEVIRSYIQEAIQVEHSGQKVKVDNSQQPVPEEFKQMLVQDEQLKKAFEALTPGRQRGYLLYFGQPKQEKTRISRIEKCLAKILAGKGLHDDYVC